MWEKLIYESGFINYGIKTKGGWEHTTPVNPNMNDKVVKVVNSAELTMEALRELFGGKKYTNPARKIRNKGA